MPESAAQEFARLQRLTPQDAVNYLQRRDRLTQTFSWQDLWHDEHAQQFTVSRLARLDLLKAMQDGITKSVQGDLTRRDWMRDTQGLLKEAGWWGEKEVLDPVSGDVVTTKFDSARLKLIFDTNTRMANSAGLWERVWRNRSTHPYVRYITRGDDRVREAHRAWANLTLPVDHPFWERHWPPNGWRCRCRVMSITQAEYDRLLKAGKITTEAPEDEFVSWVNKRTGEVSEVPAGITPGFDYNPGLAQARQVALQNTIHRKIADAPELLATAARAIEIAVENTAYPVASDITKTIDFLTSILSDRRTKQPPLVFTQASQSIETALETIGVRPGTRSYALDHDYTIHIHDSHGLENERLRGQVPITADDLAKIGMLVEKAKSIDTGDPSHSRNGAMRVAVISADGGFIYNIVLEVRRRLIVPFTMFKRQK